VTVAAVVLLLVMLTVLAQAGLLAALVVALGARGVPALRAAKSALREAVAPSALALATLVAAVSTAGSLYFSLVAHFVPCTLCWYQRIAMYPLVVLLGVAAWRRDAGIRPYVLALAGLGLAISAYHYLLERFPALESGACDPAAPCTVLWVWRLHYISIPMMAATAFVLIGALVLVARPEEADG
jgi:disulfide bond formation protein DsbB